VRGVKRAKIGERLCIAVGCGGLRCIGGCISCARIEDEKGSETTMMIK